MTVLKLRSSVHAPENMCLKNQRASYHADSAVPFYAACRFVVKENVRKFFTLVDE